MSEKEVKDVFNILWGSNFEIVHCQSMRLELFYFSILTTNVLKGQKPMTNVVFAQIDIQYLLLV